MWTTNPLVEKYKDKLFDTDVLVVDPAISSPAFEKKLKVAFPSITEEEIKEEIKNLTHLCLTNCFEEAEREEKS